MLQHTNSLKPILYLYCKGKSKVYVFSHTQAIGFVDNFVVLYNDQNSFTLSVW